jgi:hypothetical protein
MSYCVHCRYGLSSWRPWAISLALDLLSGYGLATGRHLLDDGCSKRWPGGSTLYSLALLRSLSANKWSNTEGQEMLLRRLQLLKYLIRSPAYDSLTR